MNSSTKQKQLNRILEYNCRFGNLEAVIFLIKAGADPNANAHMSLRDASFNNQHHVVRYLLKKINTMIYNEDLQEILQNLDMKTFMLIERHHHREAK